MAITYIGNGALIGLSTDTKPTTYPAGATFRETDTGNQFYYNGTTWTAMGGAGGGEANTASNLGAGQGLFKSKVSLDLQFRSLTATSSKIALANNTNDVGLDVTEANLTLSNMIGPLSVAKGGTGAATLTGILLGNGTSALTASNTLAGITLTTPTVNGVTTAQVVKVNTDSPYTITATDYLVRVNATSGAVVLNLPTASGIAGRQYRIKRIDVLSSTNLVTIDGNGSETIDSSLTYVLYPAEWILIESDGTNWEVIARSEVHRFGYVYLKGTTPNRRYVAGTIGTSTALSASTTSPAIDTLWCTPLFVEKTTKFDVISFRCTTLGSAGAKVHVGIYRDNGNCFPGPLYFDSGDIATDAGSTSATRDITITSSLQVFQPGLYWLAWETNQASPGQYTTHNTAAGVIAFAGNDPGMGTTASAYAYTVAHTFGALPDPYTTSATLVTTAPAVGTPIVAVGLRPV